MEEERLESQTEAEMARRARAGDRAAFDAVRASCEPSVRRFARRLVGPAVDYDDIVQDAFLALYLNLHRLDPVENLRPFLYRIVRNTVTTNCAARGATRPSPWRTNRAGPPPS
jgi:RNA polymerase sigma-70 factor (ECF subfamily)